jgi:hypothetical protein
MLRRVITALVFGICYFLPCLTIEFPTKPYFISMSYIIVGLVSTAYIALSETPNRIVTNFLVVAASCFVALVLCDLLARPIFYEWLRNHPEKLPFSRPQDALFHKWPREPRLYRYYPNEAFLTRVLGNLSALSGNLESSEPRFGVS